MAYRVFRHAAIPTQSNDRGDGAPADSPGYLARLREQGWAPDVAAQPLQNEPLAVLPTGNVSNPSM